MHGFSEDGMTTLEVANDLSSEKKKALTTAITQIERAHGKGSDHAYGSRRHEGGNRGDWHRSYQPR